MIRLLIVVISIFFLTLLCMSNTDQATIWFVSFAWPISIGYFFAIISIIYLFIGYMIGILGEMRQRHRARKAESQTRSLEKDVLELHKKISQLQTVSSSSKSDSSSTSSRD